MRPQTLVFAIIAALLLTICSVLSIIIFTRGLGAPNPNINIGNQSAILSHTCPQELITNPDGTYTMLTEGNSQSFSIEDLRWVLENCKYNVSSPQ